MKRCLRGWLLPALYLAAFLMACSDSDEGSNSFLRLGDATVLVNGNLAKAIQLTTTAGEQSLDVSWNVDFSSPTNEYTVALYVGTERFSSQVKLAEMDCAKSMEVQSGCGSEYDGSCAILDNVIDCSGLPNGKRVFIGQPFTRLLLQFCVYDPLFRSFEKNRCEAPTFELALFAKEDDRLIPYNNVIPADWVENGIPVPEKEDGEEQNEGEDKGSDNQGEEASREENPLYTALKSNRQLWQAGSHPDYVYVLSEECACNEEAKKDISVNVADGQVASAFFLPNGDILSAGQLSELRTLDQWFDYIVEIIPRADSLTVEYDETLGYPSLIVVDMTLDGNDDEVTYRIGEFQ